MKSIPWKVFMLKFALAIALFLISGCATTVGDNPGMMQEPQGTTAQGQRNADLKAEANALREAIRLQQDKLDQLTQAE